MDKPKVEHSFLKKIQREESLLVSFGRWVTLPVQLISNLMTVLGDTPQVEDPWSLKIAEQDATGASLKGVDFGAGETHALENHMVIISVEMPRYCLSV